MIQLTLGYTDPEGKQWFLRRTASFGNMMRTPDPHSAMAWGAVHELHQWLQDLPAKAREQIAKHDLFVFPVDFSVSQATHAIRFEQDEIANVRSDENDHQSAVLVTAISK